MLMMVAAKSLLVRPRPNLRNRAMKKVEFRAMGCAMSVVIDQDDPYVDSPLQSVPQWFEDWEQSLSRFRVDSELTRLNRHTGIPVQVSETLWDALQLAFEVAEKSAGMVTPTLLSVLEAAGYDRSFDFIERMPQRIWESAMNSAPTTHETLIMDPSTRTVILPPGLRLDLGGTAKGWAAHRAMKRLAELGPVLVDAGGDIAISESPKRVEAWPVEVADPFDSDGQIAMLKLRGCGVATSGRDHRRWQKGGEWQHHLIDPVTMRPADTDVMSATMIAGDVMQAELAAKMVLLMGSDRGMGWLRQNSQVAGLLVLENGNVLKTENLSRFIWSQ